VMDEWITLMPAALLTAGATLYSNLRLGRLHPPFFNAIVSNVAGPPVPLYLAGARLVGCYPMGPLIGNTGLNLSVLSRTGALDVGVIACPDLVDDVRAVADGFVAAVADLLEAAESAGEPARDSARDSARRPADGPGAEPVRPEGAPGADSARARI
jgi:diacylglycerol O-acyltransferase / wax synthase